MSVMLHFAVKFYADWKKYQKQEYFFNIITKSNCGNIMFNCNLILLN